MFDDYEDEYEGPESFLEVQDPVEAVFAVIGDIHARFDRLDRVLERIRLEPHVNGILLVGDISGEPEGDVEVGSDEDEVFRIGSMRRVIARIRALGLPVRYVPGNHDVPDPPIPGNLDRMADTLSEVRIAGIGGAGPEHYGSSYEWDEDEVRAIPLPKVDILLCHAPPARTPIDYISKRDAHIGSEAIRERAEAHTGALVCGHIHESPGFVVLGGTCLCVNAGGLAEPFPRTQVAFLTWRRDPEAKTLQVKAVLEDLDEGTKEEATLDLPLDR